MNINQYFDKIYVINLKRRKDRLQKLLPRLIKNGITNYQIFEAVDGSKHPGYSYYQRKFSFFDSHGAFGILLTAYQIILDAIKNKYKRILLFEDDVVFHKNFQVEFANKVRYIPNNWKLLYFGTSMHTWRFKERCHKKQHYMTTRGSIPGAFAVGIEVSVYLELLKLSNQSSKAWDIGPLKYINEKYNGNVFIFNPYLVICRTEDSDIRNGKSIHYKAENCKWNLKLYDFE